MVALAVNTTVSYNDPFQMMSLNAIATGTDTTSSGGTLVRNFKRATLYYNKTISGSMAVSEKHLLHLELNGFQLYVVLMELIWTDVIFL